MVGTERTASAPPSQRGNPARTGNPQGFRPLRLRMRRYGNALACMHNALRRSHIPKMPLENAAPSQPPLALGAAGAGRTPESDPGGIQTHDLQNRNLTFYSAELRGLTSAAKVNKFSHSACTRSTILPYLPRWTSLCQAVPEFLLPLLLLSSLLFPLLPLPPLYLL